ncbi:MAG: hypothetical protein KY428_10635, partial [Bacteroidetes bacterium]|nr:hypothetical protein [Bacteroidota bacterium]
MQFRGLNHHKRKVFIFTFLTITFLVLALFYFLKSKPADKHTAVIPQEDTYSAYIAAYTVGVISTESPIMVRFTADVASEDQLGLAHEEEVFKIKPSVSGRAYWTDSRTLSFQPEEPLSSATMYEVTLALQKLMDVPQEAKAFSFSVKTMEQNFELAVEGMRPYDKKDLKKQKFLGSVHTADVASPAAIESLLTATQGGQKLATSWTAGEDRKTYLFTIEGVARTDKASEVSLSWNGKTLGVNKAGTQKLEVPALGDFKLMESKV